MPDLTDRQRLRAAVDFEHALEALERAPGAHEAWYRDVPAPRPPASRPRGARGTRGPGPGGQP